MPQGASDQGFVVRMKGLEPPSLAALDPKSSASTNFATSAMILLKHRFLIDLIIPVFYLFPTGIHRSHFQALKMECKDRYSLNFCNVTIRIF